MTDFAQRRSELEEALVSLDQLAAKRILTEDIGESSPIQLVDELVVPVLEQIGLKWEQGAVALAQVYMSGRISEALVDSILPLADPNRKRHPLTAIAVLEDHHNLGKRIVLSALRAGGFDLLDYGHGVKVDDLVARVKNDNIKVLLISTLMLPSALKVKNLREKLDSSKTDVRIVVGGAPFLFDDQFWKEVGADAMGRNASEAVSLVARMVGGIG